MSNKETKKTRKSRRKRTREAGWLLRRVNIGPRLLLAIAVPSVALLVLIGMFMAADIRSLLDLRSFHDSSQVIDQLVDARSDLQQERHAAILRGSGSTELADGDQIQAIGDTMGDHSLGDAIDVEQRLIVARNLAENSRMSEATLAYNELIDEINQTIESRLDEAPLGVALQRSDALRALLASEEAYLREDLEAQARQPDAIALTRLQTSASEALSRYAQNATAEGAAELERITVSDPWRELAAIRSAWANDNTSFDQAAWAQEANIRQLELIVLVRTESLALQSDIGAIVDAEMRRLGTLAAVVSIVVLIAILGAWQLRKSIVRPLSRLTVNARLLSKGELAPLDDPASDEIAEVANAFSSLSSTMGRLWTDVDAVSTAIGEREYDRRIDTDELDGDWLRLATTMNNTLETGEQHRNIVTEELRRRGAMTEISNAAVLSENAGQLTAAVLRHLRTVQAGSQTHLHEHPSGPPHYDLGIRLEPSISALEIPTVADHAQRIELSDGTGVASLVEFPDGPPAVLVLRFGDEEPTDIEPLVSMMETAGRILAQAHRRQAAEFAATHSREHDTLTGLPNVIHLRRWFTGRNTPDRQWVALGVQPSRLGDWDAIFGRNAREVVLQAIATTFEDTVRASASEISLARIGQPEFVVLVPAAEATRITNDIMTAFASPISIQGTNVNVEVSVGVAPVERTDRDLTQTLANVSAAIRHGGDAGTVVHFEARHREEIRRRTEVIEWLSKAIENRDLQVHFQPIVDAVTTATLGYECLIRGTKDGEPISPGVFIPIAEETNMIVAIGQFVLREACQALPFLPGQSPYVAVNLSPIELSDPNLLVNIEQVLHESAVERGRVVFEVTEGATTTDEDIAILRQVRSLGVKIAIDDFGSGQSNLSYLNTLPAQILKLDRSLITPMVDDPGAASVVRKAIEMAHDLNMTVVGEGVETDEELQALRRMRCDRIQGWFTGRPGPLDNFIEITIDRQATNIEIPKDSRR